MAQTGAGLEDALELALTDWQPRQAVAAPLPDAADRLFGVAGPRNLASNREIVALMGPDFLTSAALDPRRYE